MFHQSSKPILLGVVVALCLTVPAYAVKNFKISNFGNAHQIWFEAEDYDERNPDTDQYYQVVDQAGAFGKAVTRPGGAGGMIRWTFDISTGGGKGGTWYFWGRVINPTNMSDYMLVKGDPGDPVIPDKPPFPGGSGTAPFGDTDDRIFEIDVPAWGWTQGWDPEGHVKELQNGENTMYIFHRQGDSTVFWDVFVWTDSDTYVPTDDDFQKATPVLPDRALNPNPANEATDVLRNVTLSWRPPPDGGRQDLYFGTSFDVVSQATPTTDPGGAYKGRIDPNTYEVGLLPLGQTCYWRVDKVNADATAIKGTVWSFTVEPFTYQVTGITATASSFEPNFGPANTVDGSGLSNNLHSTTNTAMWVSAKGGPQPTWIQFQFDTVYKLFEMRVWNYNALFEGVLGFGFKDVTIESSTDGTTWTVLKETQFARAPGLDDYAVGTTVDLAGTPAKFIRLTPKNNWGGLVQQFGLSEVQFYYTPVNPRQPVPATGAQGMNENGVLNWRAGREAASHMVYFGTDPNAVRNGTAAVKTVTDASLDPGPLEFGKTYYWKVVEINEAAAPKSWEGDVWSFSTREALVVDDFESYTDEQGNCVFDIWVDGFTNSTGSVVGLYPDAVNGTFCETTITHGGKQSMPFEYNNVKAPYYSEAERTFDTVQDWTVNGADTLVLYFRGNPAAFAEAAGTITMSGGGTDIWNTTDEFRFAFKSLTGDGAIVAKVESVVDTDPWAKCGVMIRESLDPGSRFAAVYATPGNGVRFQARTLNAGSGTSDTSVATPEQMALQTPVWIKIERKGSSFSCFYSTDGVTWTTMSWNPQTINMTAGTVSIGLAVTSHNANAATTAVFSDVATTGNVTGAWQVQAIGVAQPANDAAPLYLVVQDSAGKNKVITHPDPAATTLATWQAWRIPLSEISAGGIKLTAVKKLVIGVGDRANPKAGGAGKLYIDDMGVGHPAAVNP